MDLVVRVSDQFKYPVILQGKKCFIVVPAEYLENAIDSFVQRLTKLHKEIITLDAKLQKPGFKDNAPKGKVNEMSSNYNNLCQERDVLMISLEEALAVRYPSLKEVEVNLT